MIVLMTLLGACADPALPALSPPPADLRAHVAEAKVDEGETVILEVEILVEEGWTLELAEPQAEGLSLELVSEEGPTRLGVRDQVVRRYALTGDVGSYVVYPGAAKAAGPGDQTREIQVQPIFVDIGVDGPGGDMAGLEGIPEAEPPNWALIAGVAGGALALSLLGGWLWWRARNRSDPDPDPDPPHVAAIKAWDAARGGGVGDYDLALALSMILREYLEAIHGWPATARTTREILRFLENEGRMGVSDRLRASRVLDATDRLKFAREGGGEGFFDNLDGDFRGVIAATRPSTLGANPGSSEDGD